MAPLEIARPMLRSDPLILAPQVALARGRAHEVAGRSRVAFALLVATLLDGPVLWLQQSWGGARLTGDGLSALVDPSRLAFARAKSAPDLLWAAEEALRAGMVPLVVLDLQSPPGLTPVRRLHLASGSRPGSGPAPIGLLLTPGNGGAPGVETRWRLDPSPGWASDGDPRWRLTRLRARTAPETSWEARLGTDGGLRLSTAPPPPKPTAT